MCVCVCTHSKESRGRCEDDVCVYVGLDKELWLVGRLMTLQHTATRCNTLQNTATYCNTDVWRHIRPQSSDKELVVVGQVVTVVMTVMGLVWIPVLAPVSSGLYIYTHKVCTLCTALQHTATHCNTLQHVVSLWPRA